MTTTQSWVSSGCKIHHFAVETLRVEQSTNGSGLTFTTVRTACGGRLMAVRSNDNPSVKCGKCRKAGAN